MKEESKGKRDAGRNAAGGQSGGSDPISEAKASQIVEEATREADDVNMTMTTDPVKQQKLKSLKPTTKEAVKQAVRTGDPSQVVLYIKQNKKDFLSGVYSTVFMSAIRKKMGGEHAVSIPATATKPAVPKPAGKEKREAVSGGETSTKRAKTSHSTGDAKPHNGASDAGKGSKKGTDKQQGKEQADKKGNKEGGDKRAVKDDAMASEDREA